MLPTSLLGVLAAMVLYAVSVSPSLLPRPWWWHAFISGILIALGYGLGALAQAALRWGAHAMGVRVEASDQATVWVPRVLGLAFILWFVRAILGSYLDSREAARMVHMPPESPAAYLGGVVGAVAWAYLLAGLGVAIGWVFQRLVMAIDMLMPRVLAVAIAAALVVALIVFLTNRILLRGFVTFFSRQAWKLNNRTARGIYQPTEPQRSGSPASFSRWETMGNQGQVFLGRGPRRKDIEDVTGRPALEPIRVYAGLAERDVQLQESVDLVVRELRRTGAFDRAVLVVPTATGSGWVDEWAVQSLEYLCGGDCATASFQYSYLPSAVNFLTGLDLSVEAGRTLFKAVRRAVDELPQGHRPALIASGESLGAHASQGAFPDVQSVLTQTDGALWVGTPSFTPLHRALTAARHGGTPEVAPVYRNGRHVRFACDPGDLLHDFHGRELGAWDFPRVVYVQHASDPVVWWSFRMLLREPDWLREKVGRDVSPAMQYTRFATWAQVTCDMPVAGTAPSHHGHTYHEELIPAWEEVLGLHDAHRPTRLPAGYWVTPDMRRRIAAAITANIAQSDRH